MGKKDYPDLEAVVDDTYKLVKGIGKGGFARVYLAEVDLDNFDYATVVAFREKKEGMTTSELPSSRQEAFDRIEDRIKELKMEYPDKSVRIAVERRQDIYPSKGICAVKMLFNDDEGVIQRFETEWKSLMGISHPNVVKVYGGRETMVNNREVNYYAMEFLENIVGEKDIHSMPLGKKLSIIKQAATGLSVIHKHGMVHRDIKPDNIIVTDNDGKVNAKITDMGIAKDLESDMGLTMSEVVMGTPYYMSYEQASGSKNVDKRTDIYSLGATLYSYILGKPPYNEQTSMFQIMRALHEKKKPENLNRALEKEEKKKVPEELEMVVYKMMEIDREQRYQSMEDVIRDISALMKGRGTSVRRSIEATIQSDEFKVMKDPDKTMALADGEDKGAVNGIHGESRKPKKSRMPWYAGSGIGLAALLSLGVYSLSGKEPEPVEKPEPIIEQPKKPEKDYSKEVLEIYSLLEKEYSEPLHRRLERAFREIPEDKREGLEDYLEKADEIRQDHLFEGFKERYGALSERYESLRKDPEMEKIQKFRKDEKKLKESLEGFDDKRGYGVDFDTEKLEMIIRNYRDAGELLAECNELIEGSKDMRYLDEVQDKKEQARKLIEGTGYIKGYQEIANRIENIRFDERPTLDLDFEDKEDKMHLKDFLKAEGEIKEKGFLGEIELNDICSFEFTGKIRGDFYHGHCFYDGKKLFAGEKEYRIDKMKGLFRDFLYMKSQ